MNWRIWSFSRFEIIRFDNESRKYSIIATIFSFFRIFLLRYLLFVLTVIGIDYFIGYEFYTVAKILVGSLVIFYFVFFLIAEIYDRLRKSEIRSKEGSGFVKIGNRWYYYERISYEGIFEGFTILIANPKLLSAEAEFVWL